MCLTLIKRKSNFPHIRKFRKQQLQSHILLTATSLTVKHRRFFSYIRKPFLIYDFATAPIWISLCMRKILFYFLSVYYDYQYVRIHGTIGYKTLKGVASCLGFLICGSGNRVGYNTTSQPINSKVQRRHKVYFQCNLFDPQKAAVKRLHCSYSA